MQKKQKLEITWIGKDARPRLEPRILLEDPLRSYHAKHRGAESDIFDNRLIFGDNLLALEAEFAGKSLWEIDGLDLHTIGTLKKCSRHLCRQLKE